MFLIEISSGSGSGSGSGSSSYYNRVWFESRFASQNRPTDVFVVAIFFKRETTKSLREQEESRKKDTKQRQRVDNDFRWKYL